MADDFEFCDAVYCGLAAFDNRLDVGRYGYAERVITLTWYISGIVGNGGIHYLFEGTIAGDPDFAHTANAFQEIGAQTAYGAFVQLFGKFPGASLPDDVDERLMLYERIPEAERNRINNLFWDDSDELQSKLASFIRKNEDEVRALLTRTG